MQIWSQKCALFELQSNKSVLDIPSWLGSGYQSSQWLCRTHQALQCRYCWDRSIWMPSLARSPHSGCHLPSGITYFLVLSRNYKHNVNTEQHKPVNWRELSCQSGTKTAYLSFKDSICGCCECLFIFFAINKLLIDILIPHKYIKYLKRACIACPLPIEIYS